jgi:WD40 repeat protein
VYANYLQSTGRIILVDISKKETIVSSKWTNHTGRISSLDFSKDGKRIVSGGLDEAIYVWHVEKTLKNVPIKVSTLGVGVSVFVLTAERTPWWSGRRFLGGWKYQNHQYRRGRLRSNLGSTRVVRFAA